MRRLLQVRLLFVLIALLLVPALALPFAERLRTEWVRYWEAKRGPASEEIARQERFLLIMKEIESLRVRFPDEPPLGYPTPERWEELMAREKARETTTNR